MFIGVEVKSCCCATQRSVLILSCRVEISTAGVQLHRITFWLGNIGFCLHQEVERTYFRLSGFSQEVISSHSYRPAPAYYKDGIRSVLLRKVQICSQRQITVLARYIVEQSITRDCSIVLIFVST